MTVMLIFLTACNIGLETTIVPATEGDEGGTALDDADGDGFTIAQGDCDDEDGMSYPGGDEICDGADNDCDGLVDEDDELSDGYIFYADTDDDGFGDPNSPRYLCHPVPGFVENTLDCDDTDPSEPVVVDQATGAPTGIGTMDAPLDTIQAGITTATSCVAVYPGTYTEAITFDGKDLYVFGVEGSEQTTIDATGTGEAAVRFTIFESEEAILEGFTLLGEGHFTQTQNTWACTSMYDCTEYYDIYCGGSIYVSGADPTLRDLHISGSTLPDGLSTSDGINSWFTFSYGGGVCIENGAVTMTDVTIEGNHADQGGALYVDLSSTVSLTRAWLSSNSATDGGGVMVQGGSLSMVNVGLLGNTATDSGGCLGIDESGIVVADWMVLALCSAAEGAGAWVGTGSALTLNSSIVSNNTGSGLGGLGGTFIGTYNNLYSNIGGDYVGLTEPTDGTSIALDPMFVAPAVPGDWHLSPGSPSIDAGSISATDLDGTTSDQGVYGGPSSWVE
jgi:hypothetical protein